MSKVKICGITNFDDAWVATEAGANLLGFIFYEPSPRYVTPEVVKKIVAGIRQQISGKGDSPHSTLPLFVGVFVNSPPETVAHILNDCGLDAAQLHGNESPEVVARFKGRAFKALRPKSVTEAEALVKKYIGDNEVWPVAKSPAPSLPRLLVDAYHPTLYGGTGHVTDWTMAAAIARQHSMMLAGSLTPANVAEAIEAVRPWGVDVSSGVEAKKGKKDHVKVQEFIAAVQSNVKPVRK